jgi:2-keto-4-pentenoate hydratase
MSFDVARASALLSEAREARRQVVPFAPAPASEEEAYAVQELVVRRFGPAAGWKVGAKAPGTIPNASPLFSDIVRPSPANWPSASLHMIGIEAELAFRLGRDVGPSEKPLNAAQVWDAIASVHAAVEIVDTRLQDWKSADRLWVLADNQSNGGFVYDPEGVAPAHQSYENAAVHLTINGATAVQQGGGNAAGDPRWLVEWLVNHCAMTRGGIRAGTFITTGSYTGMLFVEPGASIEARFDGIGEVRLKFT